MKRRDLKPCAFCSKRLMHTGLPLFWRVSVERMAVDLKAVRTVQGLSTMLGNEELANVMSGDPNFANSLTPDCAQLLVCETCAVQTNTVVAHLAELASTEKGEH